MITKQDAAEELLKRRAARTFLHKYIEFTNRGFLASYFSNTVCAAIDNFIHDVFLGVRPVLVFQAPPQHGKLIADQTPVITLSGWKTHGELKVGDKVCHPSGNFIPVVALSEKNSANMRVEFSNGDIIYCHENHEWVVFNVLTNEIETIETCKFQTTTRFISKNGLSPTYRLVPRPNDDPVFITDVRFDYQGYIGNCLQVGSSDGLYLVGKTGLPTHNSEIVSRRLPAYLLGKYPDLRIGCASYSDELSGTMAQDVRRNLAAQEHLVLFPKVAEKKKYDIDRVGEFTAPGGKGAYLGVGVGAGLTGRPVDIGIIDDPVKNEKEALSQTIKENHWNWYQSVFTTRLSEKSGQIIMATSWSEDDLTARVCKKFAGDSRLKILRFPAINLPDHTGYDRNLPEGALVPALHSIEKLRETKELLSDYWWSSLYQQSPRSIGGNIFKEHGIQYYLPSELPNKFDKIIASWDCTFKDTNGSDYVVGQVWGKSGANCYLLDQIRERMSFTKTVDKVATLRVRWPEIREILIEDKANGPAVIDTLRKTVHGLIPIEPDGSKLARAHAITSYWEAKNIFLPHPDFVPWTKELVAELTSFPISVNDDQVDAMTQAIRRLYPVFERIRISQNVLSLANRRRSA